MMNTIINNLTTRCLIGAFLSTVSVYFLVGCGSDTAQSQSSTNASTISNTVISKEINPCSYPDYWPLSEKSSKYPFLVHYSNPDEKETAVRIVNYLNTAWQVQIDEQGFTAPPSDAGTCGPDGRFDVFIRRGINSCKVDLVTDEPVTQWGGRATYMEVDPWGDYGDNEKHKLLATTIAHEFNHASQAVNDEYDLPISYEMTSCYIDQFYGPQDVRGIIDFQKHPDWGILRYDSYLTFYMYGSALYLHFLRDRYFGTDDGFIPKLWVNMRNKPDSTLNSPNFVEALNMALKPKGLTFLDTVPEFARWRYYTGKRKDPQHFRNLNDGANKTSLPPVPEEWQMALLPEAELPIKEVSMPLVDNLFKFDPPPMMIGSGYITIKPQNALQASFQLTLFNQPDPTVRWVVQAVPGVVNGSDGETVDLSSGTARVSFTSKGFRTVIVTALPASPSAFDPNHQTAIQYPVSAGITP